MTIDVTVVNDDPHQHDQSPTTIAPGEKDDAVLTAGFTELPALFAMFLNNLMLSQSYARKLVTG